MRPGAPSDRPRRAGGRKPSGSSRDAAPRSRGATERPRTAPAEPEKGFPRRPARPKPRIETSLPRWLQREIEGASRPGEAPAAMRSLERAMAASAEGDQQRARREAIRAKQAAPRSSTVRGVLGRAAFAVGEWREATQELLAYKRMGGTDNVDPMLAECYRRDGKLERALSLAEAVPRTEVDAWIEAQIVRARVVADGGRAENGLALLRALRPPSGASAHAKAKLLGAIRDLEEAAGN